MDLLRKPKFTRLCVVFIAVVLLMKLVFFTALQEVLSQRSAKTVALETIQGDASVMDNITLEGYSQGFGYASNFAIRGAEVTQTVRTQDAEVRGRRWWSGHYDNSPTSEDVLVEQYAVSDVDFAFAEGSTAELLGEVLVIEDGYGNDQTSNPLADKQYIRYYMRDTVSPVFEFSKADDRQQDMYVNNQLDIAAPYTIACETNVDALIEEAEKKRKAEEEMLAQEYENIYGSGRTPEPEEGMREGSALLDNVPFSYQQWESDCTYDGETYLMDAHWNGYSFDYSELIHFGQLVVAQGTATYFVLPTVDGAQGDNAIYKVDLANSVQASSYYGNYGFGIADLNDAETRKSFAEGITCVATMPINEAGAQDHIVCSMVAMGETGNLAVLCAQETGAQTDIYQLTLAVFDPETEKWVAEIELPRTHALHAQVALYPSADGVSVGCSDDNVHTIYSYVSGGNGQLQLANESRVRANLDAYVGVAVEDETLVQTANTGNGMNATSAADAAQRMQSDVRTAYYDGTYLYVFEQIENTQQDMEIAPRNQFSYALQNRIWVMQGDTCVWKGALVSDSYEDVRAGNGARTLSDFRFVE